MADRSLRLTRDSGPGEPTAVLLLHQSQSTLPLVFLHLRLQSVSVLFPPRTALTPRTLCSNLVSSRLCVSRCQPSDEAQSSCSHLARLTLAFVSSQFPQQRPAPPTPWTTTWRRPPTTTSTPTSRRPRRAWRPSTARGCLRWAARERKQVLTRVS